MPPLACVIALGRVMVARLHIGQEPGTSARTRSDGSTGAITSKPYRLMKVERRSDVLWVYEEPAHHDFPLDWSSGVR